MLPKKAPRRIEIDLESSSFRVQSREDIYYKSEGEFFRTKSNGILKRRRRWLMKYRKVKIKLSLTIMIFFLLGNGNLQDQTRRESFFSF